jgi:hypothetical protein
MAIPTTLPIKLSDVCLEIYGSTNTSGKSLSGLFAAADGSFNATYEGSKDRLTNFRGYTSRTMTLSRTNCWFSDMGEPCTFGDNEFTVTSTHAWYSETFPGGAAISPQSGNAGVTNCTANWGGVGDTQTEYFYWTSDDTLTDDIFTVINLDIGEACI